MEMIASTRAAHRSPQSLWYRVKPGESRDLSADGRLVAAGSSDGSVILWDYATGQAVRRFEGHMGWIFDVALSPDGATLYSASGDEQTGLPRLGHN